MTCLPDKDIECERWVCQDRRWKYIYRQEVGVDVNTDPFNQVLFISKPQHTFTLSGEEHYSQTMSSLSENVVLRTCWLKVQEAINDIKKEH